MIAVVSLVSPYAVDRALARSIHEEHDLVFIEVWVDTPLEECERRDPKGLFARARQGDLQGLTGVDDPYEAPQDPEFHVQPGTDDPVAPLIDALAGRGLL